MCRIWLVFSQAVTVAVAILFVLMTFKPQWLEQPQRWMPPGVTMGQPTAPVLQVAQAASGVTATQPLSAAAQRAAPAVVSVTTSKHARSVVRGDPWFHYFFGQRGGQQAPDAPEGLGSGVIVSADGYLLTNNHVVEGADGITVRLSDGREVNATLVGADPETDVAVLKINADRLPVITLGSLSQLHVGDAVLAIGNPFNVGQTVTSGIVSALGRSGLGLSTFENFIQTDAAINPGNSGGALVDAAGNLVGINTAIYSRSGGSLGIGFAIPVDLARQVMDSLIKDGQVTRGWMGVQPRELDPDFVQSFKLPISEGVLITGVLQDGPASQAGLKPGDVVVRIQGQPVRSVSELLSTVAAITPGTEALIAVQRGEQALEIKVTIAKRPKTQQRRRNGGGGE
ncbi:S1C family serine protease [Ideonella paludis]|uniref:Do family serine endopeptidase n=1 Tax=Ideonella paludis TaxID=1233411 RepID=A0ABS5DYY8_9BURK|nr:Do family serine endopeptidase [Ideonella paludis]MBQ0936269.1 Do family serine endopeptidase [Ideonella paludis]